MFLGYVDGVNGYRLWDSTTHKVVVSRDVVSIEDKIQENEKGGRKPIGNKWVYKIKKNDDDQVERYRAKLVVKGYSRKEGIDFNEIFSPVVQMTIVQVVMAMCATYDLHLKQLDVKTAFLYGNLEEDML
ncbi:retrovirus-related pol polyprotein from transposon TNT 1-94 [Tanacetum coccineum]|uniref:Retrovirus-related pol polyprotein from transposon TNT 1-94 n=1 Tax=Tanacetum coccineum TaxID=301880 RepID=A0ABQ4XCK1_9ASTR